jgi:chorismate mutase-like protein
MDLKELRTEIDAVDAEIVDLLVRRLEVVSRIGAHKKKQGVDLVDQKREQEVFANIQRISKENGLDADFVQELFEKIIAESCKVQENL